MAYITILFDRKYLLNIYALFVCSLNPQRWMFCRTEVVAVEVCRQVSLVLVESLVRLQVKVYTQTGVT